ncbi:MAG: YihA family ribosome biogenesis GTP-binding protein [Clostridia bacterium]|nr:YihA family ribosome biogenesis GTP-binding protein [Clostridia bacterium]MBQ9989085.1 YihA family ribosome biogenesis GTP-binding protein [Clostridia bacterium]
MQINKARLVGTYFSAEQYAPSGLPEIAIVGRSNAGKSSLINRLCNNNKLARTSATPGKTRSINCYEINQSFALMDLPGYGYAAQSEEEKRRWGKLIDGYFTHTEQLCHLLILCDIRHDPSQSDRDMVEWVEHYQIPYTMIATKADKIAKSKRKPQAARLAAKLGNPPFVCFSATEEIGKNDLLQVLETILTKNAEKGLTDR